jgi:predicted NAD/FAD-dependent oxidoreductase
MSEAPRVTVAGGGIAGLTAAYRLAERGYRVKLYEAKSWLGGDLGSRSYEGGVQLDVYPHMYLSWYGNFWRLLEDVTGDEREERFRPFTSVKQLAKGGYPEFTAVGNANSARSMWHDMVSGALPPADMFLFAYATVDLLAERLNPTMSLDDVSVNGFMRARPYMTNRAADACDAFITRVWAIRSYLAGADDYQAFLEYNLAEPAPTFWLARGPADRQVIDPLRKAAEAAGVEIERNMRVTSVACADGRVTEIGLGDDRTEQVDELILAVPEEALLALVRSGGTGEPIVKRLPRLAEVSRLQSQRIPIMFLHFNRKLRHIPPEPVGLFGSDLCIAFTDISQTWEGVPSFAGKTVLAVSSSDLYGLPGTGPDDDAHAMLVELAEYLDFDPGKKWRDSGDIDWDLTRFEENTDATLFINETGTDVWRPPAACDGVSNLTLAGDFCANRIGLTVIESAVTTGLEAARVIVERRGFGRRVEISEPDSGFAPLYVWLRYAWMPYAAAAKMWSSGSDIAHRMRGLLTPGKPPGR